MSIDVKISFRSIAMWDLRDHLPEDIIDANNSLLSGLLRPSNVNLVRVTVLRRYYHDI